MNTDWQTLINGGWRVAGMNHYALAGVDNYLFCSMTRGGVTIKAEGPDERQVFRSLLEQSKQEPGPFFCKDGEGNEIRVEVCCECKAWVSDWVDPDEARGPICRPCETLLTLRPRAQQADRADQLQMLLRNAYHALSPVVTSQLCVPNMFDEIVKAARKAVDQIERARAV